MRLLSLVARNVDTLRSRPAQLVKRSKRWPQPRGCSFEEEIESMVKIPSQHVVPADLRDRDLTQRPDRIVRSVEAFGGESLLNRHGLKRDDVGEIAH